MIQSPLPGRAFTAPGRPTPAAVRTAGRARQASVMIEGRRSPADIEGLVRAMRLGPAAVDLLQRMGRLDLPAPGNSFTADLAQAGGQDQDPALAASVRYAVELAGLLLAGRDDETLALAAAIRTRAAFLDWFERCTDAVARHGGRQRAAEFRSLVRSRLARPKATVLDIDLG